ncbi:phosphosulfolactate synthase [Alsobacter sp. R-9]
MTAGHQGASPFGFIEGAARRSKPREAGLTIVADRGYGEHRIADLIATAGEHVDWVKFAIGHWRVLPERILRRKIEMLHAAGIRVFLAGDASEAAWLQGDEARYLAAVRQLGADGVEVSSAQVLMPIEEKIRLVSLASDAGLLVVAEAGRKGTDPRPTPEGGILREIERLRSASPWRVLVQAEGITEAVEEPRRELIEQIVAAFGHEGLIFQAKDAPTQEFYVRTFGADVSLDIEDDQAVALELLRLGLRKSALAGRRRDGGKA